MRKLASLFGVLALLGGVGRAATGKPDFGNFIGTDSLMPAPSLPAQYLTLPDVSGATYAEIAMNLPGDGDDAFYALTQLNGAHLYGSALNNCAISHNGFITCNGGASFFDNQALPDTRFGGQVLIAPYWDDLTPVPGTSKLETWTLPGGLIVQWTDFAIYGDATARLTFRATFDLASPQGAVVFQYLKMTGADGSSATIGIQRAGATAWNLYAYNTKGAVLTGTAGANAALQAILFGYDTDGDRLSDPLEGTLGTDPALHDSDTGGLDDGAELAAGKDPKSAADDGAATDGDGDTITDASEKFYGTDPAKKDSDGDSSASTTLDDNDELYTRHTDPTRADTDNDGTSDSTEIDGGTDPLDPTSAPPVSVSTVDLAVAADHKRAPRSVIDANGDLHVVATNGNRDGIYYWMVDGSGTVKIPETLLKVPSGGDVQRPIVRAYGGKIYIAYNVVDRDANTARVGLVRINPANAPEDGSPVLSGQLIEVSTTFAPAAGYPRHFDMQVDGNGVHLAYIAASGWQARGGSRVAVGYTRLSLDGVAQQTTMLPIPPKGPNGGMHKWSRPTLVLSGDGTVNLLLLANTRKMHTSIVWTTIKGATVKTRDLPLAGAASYLAAATNGPLIDVFVTGVKLGGVQLLVLDPRNITESPTTHDFWLAPATIDPGSLLVYGPVIGAGDHVNQASLAVLPNGNVVGYYNHKDTDDLCLIGLLPTGASSTVPFCLPGEINRYGRGHGAAGLDLHPLADGTLVVVSTRDGTPGVKFSKVPMARLAFPATPTTIPNSPPRITSTPPSGALHIGQPYTYMATATDAETPTALTWKLSDAPAGMTLSTSGAVSWTPQAADVGSAAPTLQVCDGGSPARCVAQHLELTVAVGGAPLIVSLPPPAALIGAEYAYQIVADDPDGDVTGYAITAPATPPGDMAVSSTGLLTWTPTSADLGSKAVTVTATDAAGHTATQTFTILVTAPMAIDPVFQSLPATTATVGRSYVYKAAATDPGDPSATMTYELMSTPSGNMALSADGTLTWTPTSKERGTQAITIVAKSSSGRMGMQSFSVTVVDGAKGGCAVVRGDGPAGRDLGGLVLLAAAMGLLILRRRVRRA